MISALTHQGYSAGHLWYYHLGGPAAPPKAIRAAARIAGYRGYREAEIAEADALPEPSRTRRLDAIRQEVLHRLRADIARYRELACALNNERKGEADAAAKAFCSNVCMSMSLKYAHLYNGFAHLDVLDALPRQGDLFGL